MTEHGLRAGTTVARPAKVPYPNRGLILPMIVRSIPEGGEAGLFVNVEQAVRGETYAEDGIWVGISERQPKTPNPIELQSIFYGTASRFAPLVWPSGVPRTRWSPFVWLFWLGDCYFVLANLQDLFMDTANANAQVGSCEAQE